MEGGLVFLGLIGGLLAVVAIWEHWFSADAKIRRALQGAKRTLVREVRGGLVKLTGKLRAIEPLTGPLSGRKCAAYECVLREKQGKSLRVVLREIEVRDFLLDDGTGVARVEVAGGQLTITKDTHQTSGTLNDPTPPLLAFLERHGQKSEGWIFNRDLRYAEGMLEEGEEVSVLGLAEQEMDPTPGATSGYRQAPMRWVIRLGDQGLFISDDPAARRGP